MLSDWISTVLAISELLRRLGNDEVAIASWGCFGGREQRTRPTMHCPTMHCQSRYPQVTSAFITLCSMPNEG